MTIAAFFRTAVPCTQEYTWLVSGNTVRAYSTVMYIPANIQPMKDGFTLNTTDNSLFYFTDYQTVYTRLPPELLPPEPPVGATGPGTPGRFYFWYKSKWYVKTGDQDWTECGRNPKHYRWYGSVASDGPDIPDPIDEATVDHLEDAVGRLHFLNIYQIQPIDNYPA